jgi:hypothetical protein
VLNPLQPTRALRLHRPLRDATLSTGYARTGVPANGRTTAAVAGITPAGRCPVRLVYQEAVQVSGQVVECNAGLNLRLCLDREDQVEGAPDLDAEEIRRRHTDDGDRDALERDRRADHADSAAESLLPQRVADHGRRSICTASRHIVGWHEQSPNQRRDAEGAKEIAANEEAVHRMHLTAESQRHLFATVAEGERAVESLQIPADVVVAHIAECRPNAAVSATRKDDEVLWVRNRQRSQNQAVHKEKIAVLAPMPRASDSTATAVTMGVVRSARKASLRSCMRPAAQLLCRTSA